MDAGAAEPPVRGRSLFRRRQYSTEERFRVRRRDLDINRHVNNAVYAEWALETAPQEIAEGFRPAKIEIGFRAEAFYGDTVISRCEKVEPGPSPSFVHQLLCERDGRELARLCTRWQRSDD